MTTSTFDYWLRAKGLPRAQREARAAGAIFHWCVSQANFSVTPNVLVAQFGDGYAQRRPNGINTQSPEWSVEMANIEPATCDDVLAFLEARNGVDVFNWTPPRSSKVLNVICPEWSSGFGSQVAGGVRLMNVNMTFQEVHQ